MGLVGNKSVDPYSLFDKDITARSLTFEVVYEGFDRERDRATHKFKTPTNSIKDISEGLTKAYCDAVNRSRGVRKLSITFNNIEKQVCEQLDFFSDQNEKERENKRMKTINGIRRRYGKNSILKGRDLESFATERERNMQIGGHRSGEV